MTSDNVKKLVLFFQRVQKMRVYQQRATEAKAKGRVSDAKSLYNDSRHYSTLVDETIEECKIIVTALDQPTLF